jgi:hypothetical protein
MTSIEELKQLKKTIEDLSQDEKKEIFKIIKNADCNYTKNNNGIFINMNNFSIETIENINKFINYSRDNIKLEKERIEEFKEYNIDISKN